LSSCILPKIPKVGHWRPIYIKAYIVWNS
jgi:hypothetical protein